VVKEDFLAKKSIILTSWDPSKNILPNKIIASAILDRLLNYSIQLISKMKVIDKKSTGLLDDYLSKKENGD